VVFTATDIGTGVKAGTTLPYQNIARMRYLITKQLNP
jgi:hypothetical protein